MPPRPSALITPRVLKWARTRLGLDLVTAARQIGAKEDQLAGWESGVKQPTVKQLYTLAEKYGQPPAVFYLSNPPADEPLPHEFRFLPEAQGIVDQTLVKEIRRVQRLREEATDLLVELGEQSPSFHISAVLDNNPEAVARELRDLLGVNLQDQFAWKSTATARKAWTDSIEKLGVFVFAAEKISITTFRGVSLSGDGLSAIILNGQDSDAGRIFTLMHEIGHLALRNAGICNPFDQPYQARTLDSKIEWFCNRIAANILMPKATLLREREVVEASHDTEWSDEVLATLAHKYSVSREAMLVRLLELGKTTPQYYASKREDFKREYERYRARRKQQKAPVPYKYRILAKNGRAYSRLVLNALYENVITTADLASLAGVNLKHMEQVEKELFGRALIFSHGA